MSCSLVFFGVYIGQGGSFFITNVKSSFHSCVVFFFIGQGEIANSLLWENRPKVTSKKGAREAGWKK
jgi:hypothetical protein